MRVLFVYMCVYMYFYLCFDLFDSSFSSTTLISSRNRKKLLVFQPRCICVHICIHVYYMCICV